MQSKVYLTVLVLLLFAGSYLAKLFFFDHQTGSNGQDALLPPPDHAPYQRVVSMSPSVTEILFSLGLGDRVVGVTEFCDYPPEAASRPRIGGYFNPNYEAIVALEPDLVILLEEHAEPRRALSAFDIAILVVSHKEIRGILDSINAIGRTCSVPHKAEIMVSTLEQRIETIEKATRDLDRPSVLVSVGRPLGTGEIREVYVAGQEGFYECMIDWAGGKNVYQGQMVRYPLVSAEGILTMNPQIIIDISAETETMDLDESVILKEWDSVSDVDAVKNGRVHILGEDYVGIPGPRFVLTLERIAEVIHPEIKWDEL